MRMHYIFLLIFNLSSLGYAKEEVHFVFEILKVDMNYRDILQEKSDALAKKGFECEIVSLSDKIALRCNDTYNVEEMPFIIQKFKDNEIGYTIIDMLKHNEEGTKKKLYPMYIGYNAYDGKNYLKAKEIFQKYYEQEQSLEYSKAYALALFQLGEYDKAINVLKPYRKRKETSELYLNILSTYFDLLIKDENNAAVSSFFTDYNVSIDTARILNQKFYKNQNSIDNNQGAIVYKYIENKELDKAKKMIEEMNDPKLKETLYQSLAYKYIEDRKYKEAIEVIESIASMKLKDDLNHALAYKYIEDKELDKAYSVTETISSKKLKEELYQNLTYKYIENKQLEKAKDIIALVLDEEVKEKLNQSLAYQYIKNRHFDKAAATVASVTNEQSSTELNLNIAYKYIERKEFIKAEEITQRISSVKRKEKLYDSLAYKYIQSGYLDKANTIIQLISAKKLRDDLYLSLVYKYIYRGKYAKAKNIIKSISSAAIKDKAYLSLAYKNSSKKERLQVFERYKNQKRHNFKFMLSYLYLLKDFDSGKFKKNLLIAKKNFSGVKQRRQLFILERNYSKEILQSYSKKNLYETCYTYAQKLSKKYSDTDIYRTGGWCAYNAGKYFMSKKFFERIPVKRRNNDDNYALALSLHKMRNDKKAIEVLDQIKKPNDYERIGMLYNDLGESRTAKEILLRTKDSLKKERLIRMVNKSVKVESPVTQASGGLSYYRNKGETGQAFLEVSSIPIDIDYITEDKKYHIYGNFDALHLSNGTLAASNTHLFGSGEDNPAFYHGHDHRGFEGVVGLKSNLLDMELGFTPVGYDISPTLVGSLNLKHRWGNMGVHTGAMQELIKQSYLSYVGQSTIIDGEKKDWGRVLKRGVNLGMSIDGDTTYGLDFFYYPKIYGQNVVENSEIKLVTTAIYHSASEKFAFLDWGLVGVYDSYDINSNLYTYGHGGYFSPQNFWLASAVIDLGDYIGEDFYYRFSAALGYQTYDVDAVNRFPLENNEENPIFDGGYSKSGISTKGMLQMGYKINNNLDITGGMSWEKMYGYELLKASISLSYTFETQRRSSLRRLRDSYNIDQLIP